MNFSLNDFENSFSVFTTKKFILIETQNGPGILYPVDSHYFEHDSIEDLQDLRENSDEDLVEDWEGFEDGEEDLPSAGKGEETF